MMFFKLTKIHKASRVPQRAAHFISSLKKINFLKNFLSRKIIKRSYCANIPILKRVNTKLATVPVCIYINVDIYCLRCKSAQSASLRSLSRCNSFTISRRLHFARHKKHLFLILFIQRAS